MSKNKLYWICQLWGWFLYAFINIIFFLLVDSKLYIPQIISLILQTLFFMGSTHLYRYVILKFDWLKLYISHLMPRVLLAVSILGIANYLFTWTISYLLGTLGNAIYLRPFFILGNIFAMMILYFLWSLIYFMYHYVESYNTSLKYDAAIYEIKLNRLKSQLNPHFIFNALNSIRALVDENPVKAKNAITQLSNILRNSLIMDNQRLIKFNDEIKTVKDYLELEYMRFEERLKTEWNIHPDSEKCTVPPLMIQTLVENGIKHGISKLVEGGTIQVCTYVSNDKLVVEIRNSGQYLNGFSKDAGRYGIENTKERLKLLYGDTATFNIYNENDKQVITEVVIPQNI